jgi:hypothetical protein
MASCGVNLYAEQKIQSSPEPLQHEEAKHLLYAATRGGSLQIAQWALNTICNGPADNEFLVACLTRAVVYRHLHLMRVLFRYNIDPHQRAEYQLRRFGSPMEVAVQYYNRDAISLLIEHGFDLSRRISFWGSALQVANRWENRAAQQLLLDKGARLPLRYKTDLHYLIANTSGISRGFSRWKARAQAAALKKRHETSLRFLAGLKKNNPKLPVRNLRALGRFCIIWHKLRTWLELTRSRIRKFNALSSPVRTKIFKWRIRALVNLQFKQTVLNRKDAIVWFQQSMRSRIRELNINQEWDPNFQSFMEAISYGSSLAHDRARIEDPELEETA